MGSGPAAAGAALACARRADIAVTVLDVGTRLEAEREAARSRLAAIVPDAWRDEDVATITALPVETGAKGPPQKRSFGSDFPFRDAGQLEGVAGLGGANSAVISSAYGGFSTVWGAQIMPFSRATFGKWPIAADEMYEHYRAVLSVIPYAAEEDDLAGHFPLLRPARALPKPSERTNAVLDRYAKHRDTLNRNGVILGRARLALDSGECVLCGLCMTGCPYHLIYSASQTMDQLRKAGALEYLGGHLVVRVEETADAAVVVTKELATGRRCRFEADRVFVAAGAIGTTRVLAASLALYGKTISMLESAQFILPFLSLRPTRHDPRNEHDFSLNQFNLAVALDSEGLDIPQLHFYTYDPAFVDQLPAALRTNWGQGVTTSLLRRLSVAFGYLPSWVSPALTVRLDPSAGDSLPMLSILGRSTRLRTNEMLRTVLLRLLRAAPHLDLWPLLPLLRISASAKSYHWGGSFPHADSPSADLLSSDALGRVGRWRRIHAVDGSVLPALAANTFTLTVMANAHRIATTSLELTE